MKNRKIPETSASVDKNGENQPFTNENNDKIVTINVFFLKDSELSGPSTKTAMWLLVVLQLSTISPAALVQL